MIYISTGGFKSETSIDSINKLVKRIFLILNYLEENMMQIK